MLTFFEPRKTYNHVLEKHRAQNVFRLAEVFQTSSFFCRSKTLFYQQFSYSYAS